MRKTSKYPDNGHKEAVRTDQHLAILIDSGRECSGNTYQGDSEAVPDDATLIKTTERGKVQDIGGPRTMECSIRNSNSRVGEGDGIAADAFSNLSRSKDTAIRHFLGEAYMTDVKDPSEDPLSVLAFIATDVVADKFDSGASICMSGDPSRQSNTRPMSTVRIMDFKSSGSMPTHVGLNQDGKDEYYVLRVNSRTYEVDPTADPSLVPL